MLSELRVPTFARLDEYVGVWAILPEAFHAHWEAASRMDLRAHVEQVKPAAVVSEMQMVKTKNGQSVAFIPVLGTLMKQKSSMGGTSTIQLRRDIRQAANDPNVSGILLGVESPGGTVAGMHDLASDVAAARKQKPVWAHVDDLMASAAYWLGASTDRITANAPTALVGSIGTLLTIYDLSQQAEKEGVKALVFSTGPIKGAGVPGSKVTDEQQAHFQGIVNGMQAEFDAVVKRGRQLTDKQLADVGTGAVWKAPEAQDRKLIDAVQPLEKTLDELARATATAGKGVVVLAPETLPTGGRGGALPMLKGYTTAPAAGPLLANTDNERVRVAGLHRAYGEFAARYACDFHDADGVRADVAAMREGLWPEDLRELLAAAVRQEAGDHR
jgi:signal peptide peptidase SppA